MPAGLSVLRRFCQLEIFAGFFRCSDPAAEFLGSPYDSIYQHLVGGWDLPVLVKKKIVFQPNANISPMMIAPRS